MRVLVVEDEARMAGLLKRALQEEGYAVDVAADGQEGLWLATENAYGAIVLDIMLPGLDGFGVCRRLRESGSWVPVLMLTARDTVGDRVRGLDAGADDYLIKPFDLEELGARIRALLRRKSGRPSPLLEYQGVVLDPAAHRVMRNGADVSLSPREFTLLQLLMERPGTILSRAQLEERLYGWGEEVESNAVEVHIHGLRRKLGAQFILTVRGVGYRLRPAA